MCGRVESKTCKIGHRLQSCKERNHTDCKLVCNSCEVGRGENRREAMNHVKCHHVPIARCVTCNMIILRKGGFFCVSFSSHLNRPGLHPFSSPLFLSFSLSLSLYLLNFFSFFSLSLAHTPSQDFFRRHSGAVNLKERCESVSRDPLTCHGGKSSRNCQFHRYERCLEVGMQPVPLKGG